MNIKSLFAIALVTVSTTAFAQVNFGIKAGANLNTATLKTDGEKLDDIKMQPGLLIGVFTDININEMFAFETGLQFEQKGLKYEYAESSAKVTQQMNINYLTIPVDFKLNFPSGENNIYFLAGPSFGIGLSGKLKSEATAGGVKVSDDDDLEFGDDDDSDLKRLNVGLGIGAGFELACKLGIRVGYDLGVSNNIPKGDSDNSAKFSSINLALTYKF